MEERHEGSPEKLETQSESLRAMLSYFIIPAVIVAVVVAYVFIFERVEPNDSSATTGAIIVGNQIG
jgi:EamA domain-containing membrane protein RarD